ncbi:MAG: MBL fold metallo-hydrolase [Candidatus Thorarchaeota archaeon]
MQITKTSQTVAIAAIVIVVIGASTFVGLSLINNTPPPDESITLKLLENAGVMIEAQGLRIYIDPYDIPSNYSSLPADAILVTHPHGDHYNATIVNMLQKTGTINVFPENMTDAVSAHSGTGVNPGDTVQVGSITITAYYMYTEIWIEGERFTSHPPEANWTSYLIDINGFTIFHAGDSKNITEYEDIAGQVDVALLPLGPGCQAMTDEEVVDAIDKLQPTYFIPIHSSYLSSQLFLLGFGDDISGCSSCTPILLNNFKSYIFEP